MDLEINLDELAKEEITNILIPDKLNTHYKETYCNEEDLLDEVDSDFDYKIKERGKNYYLNNIISCYKNGNKYVAKVQGSNTGEYEVNVEITEDDIEYDCDCPYEYPCKHEYAVMMAISKHEYELLELKPETKRIDDNIKNIVEKIPAEDLKTYILKNKNYNFLDTNSFRKEFFKYYTKQSYDYYYNNLYNSIKLDKPYYLILENYIDYIKSYIKNNEYTECFKIIKSIIEAYADTNTLNFDDSIIDKMSILGTFLRITYRKCDDKTKESIDNWVEILNSKDFYNNIYLEDIILIINYYNRINY